MSEPRDLMAELEASLALVRERSEPRFVVQPSLVMPDRWRIVDSRTGDLARNVGGRPYFFSEQVNAEMKAERLNRNAVCLGCRHRRPVADMVERRCPACR